MDIRSKVDTHLPALTSGNSTIDRVIFADLTRGATIGESLSVLCRAVEGQVSGLVCSVLILDYDKTHLYHGAAPSLPEQYLRAIDGLPIGPNAGSCGTAAYRGAPVFVEDIATSPLWIDYKDLALRCGLQACWSIPILSRRGTVLGTFAIYYREPRLPSEAEQQVAEWALPLAAIIIERKQAADALREQRDELQIILDASPAMIWFKDKQNRILRANRAAAQTANMGKRQIEGRSAYDLYPSEAAKQHQDELEVIASGKPQLGIFEPLKIHTGEVRWLISDKFPYRDTDGSIIGVIVFARDVTEQHSSEEARREAESRYRNLVEQLPAVIYVAQYAPQGRWLYVSPQIKSMLGFTPEEWLAKPGAWKEQLHPEDRARVLAQEAAGYETNQSFVAEYRMMTREGKVIWVRDVANLLPAQPGKAQEIQGVMLDITESRNRKEELRESEARLRLALSAAEMGVWEWDAASNRTTWDAGMYRIMGVEPNNRSGSPESMAEMIHAEDRVKFMEAVRRASSSGEIYQLEFRVLRPDGKTIWINDQGRADLDGSGKVLRFRGVARDVSGQRELQEQLNRAQKMEAIGQLAGGVAHDFNNLLTIIRGHAEMLLEGPNSNDAIKRDASAIEAAADRAASITQQLLAFGRKQVLQATVLDIRGIVAEIGDMLRKLIGSSIELELNLGSEQLWVRADEGQIEQVVINLVVNARDAMPEGGTLSLDLSEIAIASGFTRQGVSVPQGKYARLVVRDTGLGMDAATQARIFEPFFTTKSAGKGTGLGLSTVYGIVKQSKGWIFVNSEIGRGTSFEIILPAMPVPANSSTDATPADRGLRGTETVLIVDDEDAVRDVVAQYLIKQGYNVLSAGDGNRAVEIFAKYKDSIHLLVTDAVMPGMSGATLARKVSEIQPKTRVLFISGYADDNAELEGVLGSEQSFLQKPFTFDALARKMRELLD